MKRTSTMGTMRTATLAAALPLLLSVLPASVSAQTACNGYSELCSKSYGNVTYVGTHNSYSVGSGSLAANQNYDVTTQLNNGIRMLQNQGHNSSGEIHLCHSSCLLLDAGTVTSYLTKVKSWLDDNPNEVITILWVNSDSIDVSTWAEAYTATGLDSLSYTPSSTPVSYSDWPTLQELISSGKRVVSFMDYGADYSSVSYILDHFTHFWETPYDETDNTFPCTVDRGEESTKMYMMNHYLDKNLTFFGSAIPVPDTSNLDTTNAVSGSSSLGQNAKECAAEHGQYPTFMLVDFYDVGNGSVFEVAATLNDVTYVAGQIGNGTTVSDPSSNSTKSSSSSSSSSDSGAATLSGSLDKILLPLILISAGLAVFM